MDITKTILEFIKNNKKYLIAYILFTLSYPIVSVVTPGYVGKLIEQIKTNKTPRYLIIIALLLIISNIMFISLDKLDTVFIPKLQAYVRINIIQNILKHYQDKFEEQEIGILISKLIKLPIVIRDLVYFTRNIIAPIVFVLIAICIKFTMIDFELGAITTAGIAAMITVAYPRFMNCLKLSKEMDFGMDEMHEDITDLFDNILDMYSMDTYEQEIEKLQDTQENMKGGYHKTFSCTSRLKIIINTMAISLFLSIIVIGYKKFKNDKIDLAGIINVIFSSKYIISKIGHFTGEINDITMNFGVYGQISDYLSGLNLDSSSQQNVKITGKVDFENVNISYGDKQVIKDFNLSVNPGDSVAIVGKIGSGKTSLVNALLKLMSVNSGKISVDGVDISNINSSSVRSQILYIRQNPVPFNRTLYENISYGNKNITRQDVESLFQKYDLHKIFNHPLDESVGRKGSRLSGGQRQIVFLLRVLLNDHPIIILDEPTSSLDVESRDFVLKMLKDILETKTVLLITHDTNLAEMADKKVDVSKVE